MEGLKHTKIPTKKNCNNENQNSRKSDPFKKLRNISKFRKPEIQKSRKQEIRNPEIEKFRIPENQITIKKQRNIRKTRN